MSDPIDVRLSGTEEDLQAMCWFLRQMSESGLIDIQQLSKLYKNRGESQLYRQYIKIKLKKNE